MSKVRLIDKKGVQEYMKFLVKEGVHSEWLRVSDNFRKLYFSGQYGRSRLDNIANISLCWTDTTQGHNFWEGLHRKWRRLVRGQGGLSNG